MNSSCDISNIPIEKMLSGCFNFLYSSKTMKFDLGRIGLAQIGLIPIKRACTRHVNWIRCDTKVYSEMILWHCAMTESQTCTFPFQFFYFLNSLFGFLPAALFYRNISKIYQFRKQLNINMESERICTRKNMAERVATGREPLGWGRGGGLTNGLWWKAMQLSRPEIYRLCSQ